MTTVAAANHKVVWKVRWATDQEEGVEGAYATKFKGESELSFLLIAATSMLHKGARVLKKT